MKKKQDCLLERIAANISEMRNSGAVKKLVHECLSKGISATEIMERGLRRGLDAVGHKYDSGEYFLAELLFAASIVEDTVEMLKVRLQRERAEEKAAIVLGTVRGDMHDIGKNIFKMLAEADGFKVYDLGVDVDPEDFVKKVKETNSDIVGLSSLLTTTRCEMEKVVEEIKKAGIRDKVKIIIGGNAVTEDFGREIGADATASHAREGIEVCRSWVRK